MSTFITENGSVKRTTEIDARGPRFGALITTIVLALVLITESMELLAMQVTVFAIGAFVGPQYSPYAYIYRKLVKPRLKSPLITEDVRPPQFAQGVGFLFGLTAFLGLAFNLQSVFLVAVVGALMAAFMNAAFDFCLGCEMYLRGAKIIHRLRSK